MTKRAWLLNHYGVEKSAPRPVKSAKDKPPNFRAESLRTATKLIAGEAVVKIERNSSSRRSRHLATEA
ncbi:hypothetical protein D3H35_09910 [Cohnella faecalis]|uniref:Uncharacterized protein n=1 Tax=Cohnella faecalis TaxID=2315694 RepID=A0A398CN02_9BACL|nr:hypothetical protein D3H35_09910 [Cohnella faecalis]